jgi:hypothetical protein
VGEVGTRATVSGMRCGDVRVAAPGRPTRLMASHSRRLEGIQVQGEILQGWETRAKPTAIGLGHPRKDEVALAARSAMGAEERACGQSVSYEGKAPCHRMMGWRVSGCWANGYAPLPTTSSPPQGSQRDAGAAACRTPRALWHDASATDSIHGRYMPSVQDTMGGPTPIARE